MLRSEESGGRNAAAADPFYPNVSLWRRAPEGAWARVAVDWPAPYRQPIPLLTGVYVTGKDDVWLYAFTNRDPVRGVFLRSGAARAAPAGKP
jgi:hypothetical protein